MAIKGRGITLHFQWEHTDKSQRVALKKLAQAACAEVYKSAMLQLAPGISLNDEVQWEVSILIADDARLQELNHQFRGKEKPTNVLSFPGDEEGYLGDIAISLDTVAREAEEQGKEFQAHFVHMTIHGLLHLLGFDHENERDAEKMEQLEVEILQKFDISNPYL